jgi:hypothetical protein
LDENKKTKVLGVLEEYLSKCRKIDEKYKIDPIVIGTEKYDVFEFGNYGRVLVLKKFGYEIVVYENNELFNLVSGAGRILDERGIPNSIILKKGGLYIDILNGKIIRTKDVLIEGGTIDNGEIKLANVIIRTKRNYVFIENWRGRYVDKGSVKIELFNDIEPLKKLKILDYRITKAGKFLRGELKVNEDMIPIIRRLVNYDNRAIIRNNIDELIFQLENMLTKYMEEKRKIANETIEKIIQITGAKYVDLIFEPFICDDVEKMIEKFKTGAAELRIRNDDTIYCYYR